MHYAGYLVEISDTYQTCWKLKARHPPSKFFIVVKVINTYFIYLSTYNLYSYLSVSLIPYLADIVQSGKTIHCAKLTK